MRTVTKDDIASLFHRSREDRFLTGLLVGVGVGALVGGLLTALTTPRRGGEVREAIGEGTRRAAERGRDLARHAKNRLTGGDDRS